MPKQVVPKQVVPGKIESIGVNGGGAWGTALAAVAGAEGAAVAIWARETEVVTSINRDHINNEFLPGIVLPPNVRATESLGDAASADGLLLAVPAQFVRSVTTEMADDLAPGTPIAICAKGIERNGGALMSEVLHETLPAAIVAVLSGPTFAAEVALGQPTAVTLACRDDAVGSAFVQRLGGRAFRPYLAGDIIGAQIGGTVKNVLAIACGIVAGRKLGDNARAALITRGMAEMMRFGAALGAAPQTLMGLCGLGDLVLTCTGPASRNFSLGVALGEGDDPGAYLSGRKTVAEGAYSASAIVERARAGGIEMPIAAAVDAIVNRQASIDDAIDGLLSRPFKVEGCDQTVA